MWCTRCDSLWIYPIWIALFKLQIFALTLTIFHHYILIYISSASEIYICFPFSESPLAYILDIFTVLTLLLYLVHLSILVFLCFICNSSELSLSSVLFSSAGSDLINSFLAFLPSTVCSFQLWKLYFVTCDIHVAVEIWNIALWTYGHIKYTYFRICVWYLSYQIFLYIFFHCLNCFSIMLSYVLRIFSKIVYWIFLKKKIYRWELFNYLPSDSV